MQFKRSVGLVLIQLVNYLSPLIALPILMTGFNAVDFGFFIFYISIFNFVYIFSDMGVNNLMPRIISVRGRETQVSEFLTVAIVVRLVAFCVLGIISNFVLYYFFEEKYDYGCMAITFFFGFASIYNINQIIVLKGDANLLLKSLLIYKLAYLILVALQIPFGFNLMYSIGTYIFCIVAQIYHAYCMASRKYGFKSKKLKFVKVVAYFKKLKNLSKSNVLVWIYTSSPIFVIEKIYGAEYVGLYGSAERIINSIKAIFVPLLQLMQIHVMQAKIENNKIHIQMIAALMIVGGLVGITVYFGASELMNLIAKSEYSSAASILMQMAFLPVLCSLSGYIGNCVLLMRGQNEGYLKSIFYGFLLYTLGVMSIHGFDLNMSAFIILMTCVELFVCFLMAVRMGKNEN